MNKTFEKAYNGLTAAEQETIVSGVNEWKRVGVDEKLDTALANLFVRLRDRENGELDNLSPFEEKILTRAVAAGNILVEGDDYR